MRVPVKNCKLNCNCWILESEFSINVQESFPCIRFSRCLFDSIIYQSYFCWRKISLWDARLSNPDKVKVYVKFCQKCMGLVEISWKGTNVVMEYCETFWFYVTRKVAKVLWISIFITNNQRGYHHYLIHQLNC